MNRRLALLPALALLAGCPSFTTMGTARTLDKGKAQVYVATGAIALRDFQIDRDLGTVESFSVPSFEVGGRYAVTDRAEFGAKLWPWGAELNAKFALQRAPAPDAGVSLAVAPAASVYSFSASDRATANYLWLHQPLLVGLGMPGGSELTLGPRLSEMLVFHGGDHLGTLFAGGSLGFAWKVTDGFRILPELTASWPVTTWSGGGPMDDLRPRGGIFQANLGFLMGGD